MTRRPDFPRPYSTVRRLLVLGADRVPAGRWAAVAPQLGLVLLVFAGVLFAAGVAWVGG